MTSRAGLPTISDRDILAARGPKNRVDPRVPYAFLAEPELSPGGLVEDVATIFLTNRECPFRCIYCDLWKNTTDTPVQRGDIPAQIDYALSRLPKTKTIKLYNSGNFFDPQAIPREDYPAIIDRVRHFDRVIVENHPRFCGEECLRFRDALGARLEIAIGLETAHPEVLPRLNKRMSVEDYCAATNFLTKQGIDVRTFVMLQPPFMPVAAAVEWAARSVLVAADAGSHCVAIIPTRGGNGILEQLAERSEFSPPTLQSLEDAFDLSLAESAGGNSALRIFVDLWDIEKLYPCRACGPARKHRLARMNDSQRIMPRINCDCEAK